MSDEVTQHQIQGTCEVVQMRGEWMEFHVDIGKQYPVKLSSKQPAIKEAAQAAITAKAVAVWSYSQRDGKENPHQPGTFFKNRYLESVVIGGELDPALAGQTSHQDAPAGAGVQGGRMPDERGVSIERQVIVKAIAPLFGAEGFDDERIFTLADRLDDWMGRKRTEPDAPAATGEPVNDGQHLDEQDDIPF